MIEINNKFEHQFLLEPVKVRIRRIIVSIWNDVTTVKYKVDCSESSVRNRTESALFRNLEEAEQYCKKYKFLGR